MKKATVLYESGSHRWQVIARDPERPSHLIDTNEYLLTNNAVSLLTDPGGQEIFPAVFSALSESADPRRIETIFASHQDPDVISSLALWLAFKPTIKCYTSWLWCSFIPHFGGNEETLIPVPDEGMTIEVGRSVLSLIPAHFLHSSGNFHLYDPAAKLLFSGDIGAALLPHDHTSLFVTDFDRHIPLAKGFHQRWMGSAQARDAWCERVSKLDIEFLCPQHGAIYRGRDVQRFIDWFSGLEVGLLRC